MLSPCWKPPAYLLPSWSDAQLTALLRRRAYTPTNSSQQHQPYQQRQKQQSRHVLPLSRPLPSPSPPKIYRRSLSSLGKASCQLSCGRVKGCVGAATSQAPNSSYQQLHSLRTLTTSCMRSTAQAESPVSSADNGQSQGRVPGKYAFKRLDLDYVKSGRNGQTRRRKNYDSDSTSPRNQVIKVLRLNYRKPRIPASSPSSPALSKEDTAFADREPAVSDASENSFVSLKSVPNASEAFSGWGTPQSEEVFSRAQHVSRAPGSQFLAKSFDKATASSGNAQFVTDTQRPVPSLLDELFPRLAEKSSSSTDRKTHKVPRLNLDKLSLDISSEPDAVPVPQSKKKGSQLGFEDKPTPYGEEQIDISILVLRSADKLLSEPDFQRIVPRGRHIAEWRQMGQYLQVIPMRNRHTLAQTGLYLLYFRNPTYRNSWRASAEHMARVASAYTPVSASSGETIPFEGMRQTERGEDVWAVLNEYALTPPRFRPSMGRSSRSSLFWSHEAATASRSLQRLVNERGYTRLTGIAGRSVLFWVDGHAPSHADITRMVHADGLDRGLHWSIGPGRISRFGVYKTIDDDEAEERFLARGQGKQASGSDDTGTEATYNGSKDKDSHDFGRWILEFDDETEARRFVRVWHLQRWPEHRGGPPSWDPAFIHAEYLW